MNATTIGRKIRRERKRQGKTQQQLGDASGISKNSIVAIEHGRSEAVGLKYLIQIAKALRIKSSYLFE